MKTKKMTSKNDYVKFVARVFIGVGLPLFLCFEVILGFVAYYSGTMWNEEAVAGWEAVRVVCGVFVPVIFFTMATFVLAIVAGLSWAFKDR